MIQMKYNGGIGGETLKDFPVSAYTFSNVDTFGAMALCWYSGLSSTLSSTTWAKVSADIPNEGWMSVNTRSLKPA